MLVCDARVHGGIPAQQRRADHEGTEPSFVAPCNAGFPAGMPRNADFQSHPRRAKQSGPRGQSGLNRRDPQSRGDNFSRVAAARKGIGGNRYWECTLDNVPAGQYSVSAELSGFSFTPSGFSNPLTVNGNLTGINLTGTSTAGYLGAIGRRVTRSGLPLSGVTVQVRQSGVTVDSGLTDSDGYYRVANLTNASYSVVPHLLGYTFSPASLTASSIPSSGKDFTATGASSPPVISSIAANPPLPSLPAVSRKVRISHLYYLI
jgi:hypothetical protein